MIKMSYSSLIDKVLADKDSKKIGRIVDIRKTLASGPVEDDINDRLVVKMERPFGKDVLVELDAKKVYKIEGYYAWMDIAKKEVLSILKTQIKIKKQKLPHKNIDLAPLKNYKAPPPST